MKESKELLENSVRCYQSLLEHVNDFKETLGKRNLSADQMNDYSAKLTLLQERVENADKKFMQHFSDKQEQLMADAVLIQKRIDMMQEIMEINNYLLPRLSSLMNITRDELNTLKVNMRQVSGYHSGTKPASGRILRNKG